MADVADTDRPEPLARLTLPVELPTEPLVEVKLTVVAEMASVPELFVMSFAARRFQTPFVPVAVLVAPISTLFNSFKNTP